MGPLRTFDAYRDPSRPVHMPFSTCGNGTVTVAGPQRQVTQWDGGSVSLLFKLGHLWGAALLPRVRGLGLFPSFPRAPVAASECLLSTTGQEVDMKGVGELGDSTPPPACR